VREARGGGYHDYGYGEEDPVAGGFWLALGRSGWRWGRTIGRDPGGWSGSWRLP